jgi:hypothetical protein
MTEQCWILSGAYDDDQEVWHVTLHRHILGEPASVEADWQWALDREEARGDVVGFAHTHPAGAGTEPSARDIQTMQVWCSALGKPLLCLIAEGTALVEPAAYVFEDDQSVGRVTMAFAIVEPQPDLPD